MDCGVVDKTEQRVEYANGSSRAALRGLAEASGHSLDYLCHLAAKGELGRVFAGGKRFSHTRSMPDEPDNNRLALALARRASPRQAQLRLMGKRFGPS
jgi:hypothetical protein